LIYTLFFTVTHAYSYVKNLKVYCCFQLSDYKTENRTNNTALDLKHSVFLNVQLLFCLQKQYNYKINYHSMSNIFILTFELTVHRKCQLVVITGKRHEVSLKEIYFE
jgi:hypothetical protein